MDIRTLIEAVVVSPVLIDAIIKLPQTGATDVELKEVEGRIYAPLNSEHIAFLRIYNGIDLDVVRINSCERINKTEYGVEFASDPAGFVYYLTGTGKVVMEDTDGGDVKQVATSFTDFIHEYVFGSRAAEFADEEWYEDLVMAGIAT